MKQKILAIDDELAELNRFQQVLGGNGFLILTATSGQEALRLVNEHKPDLIILDAFMPGMDGWQTCRCIREFTDVPIIMVTSENPHEDDIVRCLEDGADEYLTKSLGNRELAARVRAALRRAGHFVPSEEKRKTVFTNRHLMVDVEGRKVTVRGRRLRLTPHEFRLLALLVENADHVLSHQQVLERIWGVEYADEVDYVRIYVSHLRKKIEPDPSRPKYILTEPGIGYYFHTMS